MKYVPSVPPPATAPATGLEVDALAGVKRVKPVEARTLTPLVVLPHAPYEELSEAAGKEERRHDPHVHGERRTYCRRIEHLSFFVELRSGKERRRHNQRASDMTEHVDIKA